MSKPEILLVCFFSEVARHHGAKRTSAITNLFRDTVNTFWGEQE